MKYLQYKGVMEREYKMSLKQVMHQLCVTEKLNAIEGAKKLGIAKEIFVYWRHYFRLEERQRLFDRTVEELMGQKTTPLEEGDKLRFEIKAEKSSASELEELEEVVNELIGYYKHIHYTSEGLSLETAKLPLYEFSKSIIIDSRNGELSKESSTEAEVRKFG